MAKSIVPIVSLLLLLATAHWSRQSLAEVEAAPSAREGWVFIDEGLSSALVDEPAHHFHGAQEALAKGDPETAALEIRKAAAYIRIEAGRAVDASKPALDAAVSELEGLATALSEGRAVPAAALAQAFARAHQGLAQHHYLKAAQFRSEGRTEKVWHDLQAATAHLESALEWAGHEVAAGARRAAEEARRLGERARGGARWTEDEVGRAVEALGLEIEKLGRQLRRGDR